MKNILAALKGLLVDVATLQDKQLAASVAALIVSAAGSLFGVTLTAVEVSGVLVLLGSIAKVLTASQQPAPAPAPTPAPAKTRKASSK